MSEQESEQTESNPPESPTEVSAIIEENEEESTNTSGDISIYDASLKENKPEQKYSTGSVDASFTQGVSPSFESRIDEAIEPLKKHPLDDLSFEEIIIKVRNMKAEAHHLNTENDMFERYLTINDPAAIEGMATTIENAIKLQGAESVRRATLAENYSFSSDTKMEHSSVHQAASSLIDRGGPRINLTQKSDMAMRELEEIQKNLKKFYKETHRRQCNIKAELEELSLEIAEYTEALNNFEQTVVVEGMDPLTQRIPAEKFERFMQESLRASTAVVQKYRLRQSTLSAHLKKLNATLKHKKEVGESLHAVDFEKLEIENNHFIKEIDARTLQLIDLKTMNGGANLILTNQKKLLMKQIAEIQKIQNNINETRNRTEELEIEVENAEEQLNKVTAHYESIKEMTEEYKVPEVMEYVRLKSKLYDLRKNIKIWSRRSHLQNVALNSSIREMKNLTSSEKVLDSWFVTVLPQTSSSELDITLIGRKRDIQMEESIWSIQKGDSDSNVSE